MSGLLTRIFGSQSDREIKKILPAVERTNALEPELAALSDHALRARTGAFRERLERGEPLDDLLPEAFATVREAAKRTLGQRHYDVQVIGGVVLHTGRIAEMKTGEGKTLAATLPCYLNALEGRGTHVITVNDYLARRDAEWMGEIHRFLGLSVGVVGHGLNDHERQKAYAADITYATNNELGFDYLRDNMKPDPSVFVQRELRYGIVDEVDSILIDEARTPLIISGPSEEDTQVYGVANRVIPQLKAGTKGEAAKGIEETGDYWVDEKQGSATLTEQGVHKVEKLLRVDNLYDPRMLPLLHAVNQALSAHTLKKRDVDYLVEVGEKGRPEVVIIDEFTGRKMPGRRWSDGLHQAVEAKEGIPVQSENQTLASITFQNFFRMYDKLAGMTGTADTEAAEFSSTYSLDVVLVPTNRPMIRRDLPDVVYKTKREKFDAVVEDIKDCHERGQPVLVGTISIDSSERFARHLARTGIKHNVLNAKHHEREAEIVAQAGRHGAVTISTNMAGRGTDIVLGGNAEMLALGQCKGDRDHPDFPARLAEFEAECEAEREKVVAAGGLHIIGTERHESRRIDNQLRGRAGRQGDPGSSRFYLSLEDDLLRIFEADRVKQWWDRVGVEEGEAIEHRLLTRVIENAQKKVEARNFDIRKHLLQYDDVMNKQRTALYGRRRDLLLRDAEGFGEEVRDMVEGVLVGILDQHWPARGDPEPEDLAELARSLEAQFGLAFDPKEPPFRVDGRPASDRDALGHALLERLLDFREQKRAQWNELAERYPGLLHAFEQVERILVITRLDRSWKEHLHTMDGLREGINLRGYGQRDPKLEYQREGFALFEEMNASIDQLAVEDIFKVQVQESALEEAAAARGAASGPVQAPQAAPAGARESRPAAPGAGAAGGLVSGGGSAAARPRKVGRNDPCPCGSGKKYKKCCGAS